MLRTRTRFQDFTRTIEHWHQSGVQYSGYPQISARNASNSYRPRMKSEYHSWERTLNYKTKREQQGYLATLPLVHHQLNVADSELIQGTYRAKTGSPIERYVVTNGFHVVPQRTDYIEAWATTDPLRAVCELEAQYDALSKARDMKFNAPVFFGEARQTVDMFRNTAHTLGRAYGAFRKGNFKRAAKVLGIDKPTGALANNWLAYNYGWRPLLTDAVGAATSLWDFFNQPKYGGQRITVQSRRVKLPDKSQAFYNYATDGSGVPNYKSWISWTRSISGKAGLLLEVEYTSAALASSLGVGLTDPLLTAWELTPFSFVFDWFVDIGGWLETRSSLQGYKVLTGFTSSHLVYTGSVEQRDTGSSYSNKEASFPPWKWQCRSYYRGLWGGGVSSLRMPLLDALNGRRVITTASLWRQRLKGDRTDPKYPYHYYRKRNK